MVHLVYDPVVPKYKHCGCYVKNQDLLALNPGKYLLAPLVSSEYDIEIVNSIANISLAQSYTNPTEQFL